MFRYPTLLSALVSLLLFMACKAPQQANIVSGTSTLPQDKIYVPAVERTLYRTSVDGRFFFKSFHLSGILILKKSGDSLLQAAFQNEMGFSFFHFRWSAANGFKVVSMLERMNRPPLVRLLRRDFELLAGWSPGGRPDAIQEKSGNYTAAHLDSDGSQPYTIRYVLQQAKAGTNGTLIGLEAFVKKKPSNRITFQPLPASNTLPDSASMEHPGANFQITLVKINSDDE